jgi:hypothetical protein
MNHGERKSSGRLRLIPESAPPRPGPRRRGTSPGPRSRAGGGRFDRGLHGDLRGEGEQLLAVPAREVRDGPHDPFPPEDPVRKRRDVAHVDARADDGPSLPHSPERRGDEGPHRGEDDRRIEFFRGTLVGAPRPDGPEAPRELLPLPVARPGEGVDAPAEVPGDLGDDVGRRAEAVEADALGLAREDEGPPADEARAEERGGVGIVEARRDREGVGRLGDGVLRVPAVDRVPGEERPVAEVALERGAPEGRPPRLRCAGLGGRTPSSRSEPPARELAAGEGRARGGGAGPGCPWRGRGGRRHHGGIARRASRGHGDRLSLHLVDEA